MNYNAVGWFEIYVQDMPRARSFYENVFAVQLQPLANPDLANCEPDSLEMAAMEMYAFPMLDEVRGASGALVKMPGIPSGGGGTLIYFTSENCANEAARIESFGGKIFREKFSIGQYGFIVLALDTEGNMFGIHSIQ